MAIVNEPPDDVLIDILSRVPAKSIPKHWYSPVQNPSFVSLHPARPFHCVSLECTVDNNPLSMHLLPNQTSVHDLDLSFTMPHLNEDSKTNDYKVVRVATLRETMRVSHKIHIYYISADSWKELVIMAHNHNCTGYHHHPCTLLDGVFYWLSSNVYPHGSTIDALNTVEGSFERKSLPVGVGSHSWTNLCLLNDSLALVVPLYERQGKTQFDEYGVPECWTKKYTIEPILESHRPFGFQPNNDVLMIGCENGLIVSYNHSTGDIKVYKQLCNWPELRCSTQVFQYSESLVIPISFWKSFLLVFNSSTMELLSRSIFRSWKRDINPFSIFLHYSCAFFLSNLILGFITIVQPWFQLMSRRRCIWLNFKP